MILREENQVALNDVVELALKIGDHYENGANLAENPDLNSLFQALAARRRQTSEQLANILRQSGELPGEPDRDEKTLEEIIIRLQTFLATDKDTELLEERLEGETELLEAVERALAFKQPEKAVTLLDEFRRHIDETRTKLRKLQDS